MYLVSKWLPFYIIYALRFLFFPRTVKLAWFCVYKQKKIGNNIKNNDGKLQRVFVEPAEERC